ncbi:MAG: hypothetical protein AMK72_05345, partial [Planctomycetes bacterium SM23_25]
MITVKRQYLPCGPPIAIGDHAAHLAQVRLAVAHQQALVHGLKSHQVLHPARLARLTERRQGEQLRQKVLAKTEVVQAALVLDGQVAEAVENRTAEEPAFAA